MFDYSKLLGLLKERHHTQSELAKFLGISENCLTNKLKGRSKVAFSSPEISKICSFLEIDAADVSLYFFTPRVL